MLVFNNMGYLLKDRIVNILLKIRYYVFYYYDYYDYSSNKYKRGYDLTFDEDFKSNCWSNKKWVVDEIGIENNEPRVKVEPIIVDKGANFITRYNTTSHKYEFSCLSSVSSFTQQYGRFEICCKLPIGKGTWPAFWLWGKDSWPPEIDIFEAYGGKKGKDINTLCINIWPNLSPAKSTKAYGIKIGNLIKATKIYNEIALEWKPNRIDIFFNSIRVYQFTNINVLNLLNQPMRVIVNNGIDLSTYTNDFTEFNVKYIRVYNFK